MNKQGGVDVSLHAMFGKTYLQFDRSEIKKGMRKAGRVVQKEARRLVGKNNVSQPGDYPGQQSGKLSRSIRMRVSRVGLMVIIQPRRTAAFGSKEFYPSFLHYGVRKDRVQSHKAHKSTDPFVIKPRKNYMVDAQENKDTRVKRVLCTVFKHAIKHGVAVK